MRSDLITSNRFPGALKLMQANGCLISFQKVSTAAVVSAVERALGTCRGTVYVDLRSVPAPSLSTLDIIGKIYGRVATLAPQRNVVPLLSTAYPQGSPGLRMSLDATEMIYNNSIFLCQSEAAFWRTVGHVHKYIPLQGNSSACTMWIGVTMLMPVRAPTL